MGAMYCVGCNGNFGNYRAHGLLTRPDTPRFRIGLARSDKETDDQRQDVDFEACAIRITGEDDDVVPEANNVATVESDCGDRKLIAGQADDSAGRQHTAVRQRRDQRRRQNLHGAAEHGQ